MDVHFPSTKAIQDALSYDGIYTAFAAYEAARRDQFMHPEGFQWTWTLAMAVFLSSTLGLWRLWTFTVRPWMHPDEAKEVPYWVPCKDPNVLCCCKS